MIRPLQLRSNQHHPRELDGYATERDFQYLFATEMADLFQLSLQLTADAEKAETGLILAMRECLGGSTISKRWAHTWARRMVVRNAIRLVLGTENDISCETECELHLQPTDYPIEALRESLAILELPDFDRLAFVICVLERYSILDCALLLRKAPKDVQDAIVRATTVVALEEQVDRKSTFFEPAPAPLEAEEDLSPRIQVESVLGPSSIRNASCRRNHKRFMR